MRKTSLILAILTAVGGISLMVGLFFLFKHIPWRIVADKWAMFVMFETIIAVFTLFLFGSFLHDYTKDKA